MRKPSLLGCPVDHSAHRKVGNRNPCGSLELHALTGAVRRSDCSGTSNANIPY